MKKQSTINNQPSTISFWHPASLVCTVFGVGKIPFAPGTWGSLVGVVLFVFSVAVLFMSSNLMPDHGRVSASGNYYFHLILILFPYVIFFPAVYFANKYQKITGKKDAPEIVIDEVVGQIIAFHVTFLLIIVFHIYPNIQYPQLGFLLPFLTFRFFDIVKPFPVGWVDRNVKGGLGVMLDDVVAGIMAGCTSALIFWLITLI